MKLRGILVVLLAVAAAGAVALSRRSNGPQPIAARDIDMVELVSFGDEDSPYSLKVGFTVAVDSRGRYYAGPTFNTWAVAVYDSTGRYLTHIGESGDGPGELRNVTRVYITTGDTLRVWDQQRMRMTIFDPDHRFARLQGLRGNPYDIVSRDGNLYRNLIGIAGRHLPHVEVTEPGSSEASWLGDVNIGFRTRHIAVVDSGIYLAYSHEARGGRHEISVQFLDRDGEGIRSHSWSPPQFEVVTGAVPLLTDTFADSAGLLWLVYRYPTPGSTRPPRVSEEEGALFEWSGVRHRWRWGIEVWDLAARRLVAHKHFTGILARSFLPGHRIVLYEQTPEGLWRARIYRLSIRAPAALRDDSVRVDVNGEVVSATLVS